jgi:homoserine O-acetyltransferase
MKKTKNEKIYGESVGVVETQYYTFAEPGREYKFESGDKLGPITLAYETYGKLNKDKSNARGRHSQGTG